MGDKNLFPYDLAIVAIFKNEAPYLQEWLDYHLLAGAEHFYLYNNDSTDNFAQVLAPYVEADLVTLINFPGKTMQMLAYEDALEKFRFTCRYMAFIDLDEFIFPKTNQSITEVVDEILSRDETAAGLVINWQIFGSNGHKTADYSRGLLERFTRRAPSDWTFPAENKNFLGNIYIKSVVNPRCVNYFSGPHYAIYFGDLKSISSDGTENYLAGKLPVAADKIVINHYYIKSYEEFAIKVNRGCAFDSVSNKAKLFQLYDRNEVFDDGILSYRAAREENFSLEGATQKIARVKKNLLDTLTQYSPLEALTEFFSGKLETFLTCRALAEQLDVKIGSRSAEELAIVWIYQTLIKSESIEHAEVYQFIRALPEILARPFPVCRKLKQFTQDALIPTFCEAQKEILGWKERSAIRQTQKLLQLIK